MTTRQRLLQLGTLAGRPYVAWAIAVVLGVVNAAPVRFVMNPDGISYLNLATLYQRGDWVTAINGYWSPLYPLLLAVTLRIVPAPDYLESTVVHGLTVAIYLGAFAAFRFFLSEVRALQAQQREVGEDEADALSFGSLAETACAYTLFFWSAISMIGFGLVTPDMTVMLLLFVAAGVTVRLRRKSPDSMVSYVGLGAIIGVAYLTKAVMFPLGVVMCLGCGLPDTMGKAARRSALAFAGFALVASPQVAAMSWLTGHFSYGESGKIAYANEVNHVPKFWVGDLPGFGAPEHGMRKLSSSPAAYEFSLPNTTFSYPVSDQLEHWMQGVRPRVTLRGQAAVTGPIVEAYISVFDVLIVAALVLLFMKRRMTWRYLALIVPALATLVLYSLVYVESRYVGGSVVLLFLCFAASIQFNRNAMQAVSAVAAALAVYYGVSSLNETRIAALDTLRLLTHGWPHSQMETAVDLRRLGVAEGSRVAAIGYAYSGYWARLARVQIAMQVPDARAYASATDSAKANVIDAFRKSGAVAVVSVGAPSPQPGEEWRRIGPAGYWVMLLSPQPFSSPNF